MSLPFGGELLRPPRTRSVADSPIRPDRADSEITARWYHPPSAPRPRSTVLGPGRETAAGGADGRGSAAHGVVFLSRRRSTPLCVRAHSPPCSSSPPWRPLRSPFPAPPTWYTKVDEATREAQRSGRPILVDLYAAWCGWCKELDRNVFSTPRFQQFARDFVLLRVDTEDGGEGSELDARYQVQQPADHAAARRRSHPARQGRGLRPDRRVHRHDRGRAQVLRRVRGAREDALAGGELNAQKSAAAEAHMRGDGKRAAALYRKIAASGDVPGPVAGALQYMLADALRLSKDWEGARAALQRAREEAQKVNDPDLLERAEMLATNVAQESGDCKGAKDHWSAS
jgi:thiol-disulfide isomerase/thioredoxin